MIDVRRAGPGDAEELMRLRGVMLAGMHGVAELGGDWQRTGAELLRTQLAGPPGLAGTEPVVAAFVAPVVAAFVADKGDRPGLAACVLGQVDQRLPGPRDPTGLRGYVYNVATDPAYRRRGLSRACMIALLEWFTDSGAEVVDLRASPEGEPLYASLGFVRTADPAMRLRR